MFRTVPLSIIRSFQLYTQQWYMPYRFADSLRAGSGRNCRKNVWHIPLLCVQWKTPDDGQRNCPKHVEFYFKNKFEKLAHLVGFIIRIMLKVNLKSEIIFKLISLNFSKPDWSNTAYSKTKQVKTVFDTA